MAALSQPVAFTAQGYAQVGPVPSGSVWSFTLSVPSASSIQGFEVSSFAPTNSGETFAAQATLTGQGSYGPVQLRGGQQLFVIALNGVPSGPLWIMGQSDDAGNEPTGIFAGNSGGTLTTVPPQNTPVSLKVSTGLVADTPKPLGVQAIAPWPNNHMWIYWFSTAGANLIVGVGDSSSALQIFSIASGATEDLGAIYLPPGYDVYADPNEAPGTYFVNVSIY